MCGRVIQSSEPLAFAIVDGMDVRDSRAGLDVIRINDVEVTNGAAAETLAAMTANAAFIYSDEVTV